MSQCSQGQSSNMCVLVCSLGVFLAETRECQDFRWTSLNIWEEIAHIGNDEGAIMHWSNNILAVYFNILLDFRLVLITQNISSEYKICSNCWGSLHWPAIWQRNLQLIVSLFQILDCKMHLVLGIKQYDKLGLWNSCGSQL